MAITVETLEVDIKTNDRAATNGLKKVAVAAGAAYAAYKILSKIVGTLIKTWAVQEKSLLKVRSSLKAYDREVAGNTTRLEAFTSALQNQTNIGDEVTLSLVAQALAMGATVSQSEEATRAAVGLSDAMGIGLQAALKGVVNAQEGNYEQLQRYIPALKGVTDQTEAWDIINRAATSGLKSLEAQTETLTGQITRVKNSWGDWIEQVGRMVSLDPDRPINRISDAFDRFTQRLKLHNDVSEVYIALTQAQKDKLEEFKITVAEYSKWVETTAYWTQFLAAQSQDVTESQEGWSPEKTRAYWAEYTKGVITTMQHLGPLATIERDRAAALNQASTEFADFNSAIEDQVNLYYDQLRAQELLRQAEVLRAEALRAEIELTTKLAAAQLAQKNAEVESYRKTLSIATSTAEGVGSAIAQVIQGEISFLEAAKAVATDFISVILRALGEEYAVRAAAAFATSLFPPNPAGFAKAAGLAAASAGAFAASGLVKTFADGTPPGGYTVPQGFDGDNFPVMAKSGEVVSVSNGSDSGGGDITIMLDSMVLAKTMTNLIRNRQIVIRQSDLVA